MKQIKIITQLNEIDISIKFCENHIILITKSVAIRHQLAIHTMTTESLSPPNNSQTLRERLIQEGTIVPAKSTQDIRDVASEKLNDCILLCEKLGDGNNRSSFHDLLSVIELQLRLVNFGYDSETNSKKPIFFWTLSFSLVIKNINKVLSTLLTNATLKKKNFVVSRSSFYSPFKENMKNTP